MRARFRHLRTEPKLLAAQDLSPLSRARASRRCILPGVHSLGRGLPRAISGRALCVGDLDNDGKLDLLISDIEGQPLLLRNVTPAKNHWITVKLRSAGSFEGTLVIARVGQ